MKDENTIYRVESYFFLINGTKIMSEDELIEAYLTTPCDMYRNFVYEYDDLESAKRKFKTLKEDPDTVSTIYLKEDMTRILGVELNEYEVDEYTGRLEAYPLDLHIGEYTFRK